jgi:heme-degrading monooxygenase HmoA
MTELRTVAPPPDAIATMIAIPGFEVTPTILATQRGPDGDLGPESAGAILLLQATFADEQKAAGFWTAAAHLTELLADAPGFIRRYTFPDGPTINLFALWRTVADAQVFAATPAHVDAMRRLDEERWQYSHFAAIWEISSTHDRVVYCTECDGITSASARFCDECGAALADPFRVNA